MTKDTLANSTLDIMVQKNLPKKTGLGFSLQLVLVGLFLTNRILKKLPSINLLKLRYTYGLVGNDGISNPSDRFFFLSDVNLNNGGTGYFF